MNNNHGLTLENANRFLLPLVGAYVWLVRCLKDQILRLEFGTPRLVIYEPADADRMPSPALQRRIVTPTGQWTLFIEDGLWAVQAFRIECDRNTSDTTLINKCLDRLSGQRLLSINISDSDPNLMLNFDLGGVLKVYLNIGIFQNDQWSIHTEDQEILAYLAPNRIVLEGQTA